MTRETKIGLLMGLGFIVVFAVLLLQTGPKPRPGGDLPMMLSQYGNSATSRPEALTRLPEAAVSRRPATEPAGSARESIPDALTQAPEPWNMTLPSPAILGGRPDYSDLGPGGSAMTDDLTAGSRKPAGTSEITPILRVAPTNDVMPSVRPDKPTSSPQPAVTPGATPPDSPADSSPVQNDSAVPGIHVVQKGETLVKIARKHYSNTSTPVLDFLMRSNRGKLKDPHYVVEGQKLMIPVLPVSLGGAVRSEVVASPDLDSVEAADPLLSTRNGSGLRPLSSERFAPPTSALVRLDQNRTASDSSSAKRPTPSPDPAAGHKVVSDRASQKQVREAAEGGPIAAVRNGDKIVLDIPNRKLEVKLSKAEIKKRLAKWKPREPKIKSGWLARYAKVVTSANTGAIVK